MRYAKTLVQLTAAVLAAIVPGLVDGMGLAEWINVAILGVGAYQVWNAENTGMWPKGKMFASAAMSVLVLIPTFLTGVSTDGVAFGGLEVGEIVQLIIAALAPFGVYAVRNTGTTNQPLVN